MGKQNKWPGKGWQELVGLTPAPSDEQNSTPVENPQESTEPEEIEKVNISISVSDGENPISSAAVTITNNDDVTITGTTGSAGGCNLSNVPLGDYTIKVLASNYDNYTDTITVTNETTSLAITMSLAEAINDEPAL